MSFTSDPSEVLMIKFQYIFVTLTYTDLSLALLRIWM